MVAELYADGGVVGSNPSLVGGTWAWCHVNKDNERVCSASGIVRPFTKDSGCNLIPVTNNNTELIALIRGLLSLPKGWEGRVCSDSKVALGWLFFGYKRDLIPPLLEMKARQALLHIGDVEPVILDGHPTTAHLITGTGKRGNPVSTHNKFCDEECKRQSLNAKINESLKVESGCEVMYEYQEYTAKIESRIDSNYTCSVWEKSPGDAAKLIIMREEHEREAFGGDYNVAITDKEGNVTQWLVHSVHTPVVYTVESGVK